MSRVLEWPIDELCPKCKERLEKRGERHDEDALRDLGFMADASFKFSEIDRGVPRAMRMGMLRDMHHFE